MATSVALLPACGLGAKDAMADRIVDSVDIAVRAGTATGTLGVTGQVVKLPAAAEGYAEQTGQELELPPASAEVVFPVQLDLRTSRASLIVDEEALEIWDDLDLYGRRQRVAANEARPWAKVTLEELDDGEAEIDPDQDSPIIAVHAVNPSLLVDLIAGALTGSIDQRGTDDIAGVSTTRYDANFDLDKTTYDTRDDVYDDDRREAVEQLFDILNVKGKVNHGSVWLDEDGLPRQLSLRLRTEPEIDTIVDVTLRLTLETFGGSITIDPPSPRDWLEVSSVVGFLRTITPESLYVAAFTAEDGSTAPQVAGLTTTTTTPTTAPGASRPDAP